MLHGQMSVAAMQQRLQHKFGEEAAAFMLHDLKQVRGGAWGCVRG